MIKNTFLLCLLLISGCKNDQQDQKSLMAEDQQKHSATDTAKIIEGAAQTDNYLPLLNGRIGIVANQTSVIFRNDSNDHTHLVDSLLSRGVDVVRVFAPEHGFRGTADAGEIVKDGLDSKTGLPIISLYGENKKPDLSDHELDRIIFDIQDVGARFYTYISTLHYVMEACAESEIPLLILDRPNPNGHYVDGPVLEIENKSFVGMHPVPVVHGMTIGEYAKMINGEGWLKDGIKCNLTVIPVKNYTHKTEYPVRIKPSPNLPNDVAINLYPSLCFFEGTTVSAGRGTEMQFQIFGSPELNPDEYDFRFTPEPNAGAKYPKHLGKLCYGKDLSRHEKLNEINLEWLIKAYNSTSNRDGFFNDFFIKLAGTEVLRKQIENGLSAEAIRASWQSEINNYLEIRKKYLLYP